MKRLSILIMSSLLLAGPSVHAQPKTTASETEPALGEARERFQRGVDLYKEGSFDAALAEFNKAYELAPNFRVLYNMAQGGCRPSGTTTSRALKLHSRSTSRMEAPTSPRIGATRFSKRSPR